VGESFADLNFSGRNPQVEKRSRKIRSKRCVFIYGQQHRQQRQ